MNTRKKKRRKEIVKSRDDEIIFNTCTKLVELSQSSGVVAMCSGFSQTGYPLLPSLSLTKNSSTALAGVGAQITFLPVKTSPGGQHLLNA